MLARPSESTPEPFWQNVSPGPCVDQRSSGRRSAPRLIWLCPVRLLGGQGDADDKSAGAPRLPRYRRCPDLTPEHAHDKQRKCTRSAKEEAARAAEPPSAHKGCAASCARRAHVDDVKAAYRDADRMPMKRSVVGHGEELRGLQGSRESRPCKGHHPDERPLSEPSLPGTPHPSGSSKPTDLHHGDRTV